MDLEIVVWQGRPYIGKQDQNWSTLNTPLDYRMQLVQHRSHW